MLTNEIFQQDLVAIYQRQTQRRDELTQGGTKSHSRTASSITIFLIRLNSFCRETEEADTGNALAMADLGRMYADGLGREPNPALAQGWYSKALAAFLEVETTPLPSRYRPARVYWAYL